MELFIWRMVSHCQSAISCLVYTAGYEPPSFLYVYTPDKKELGQYLAILTSLLLN